MAISMAMSETDKFMDKFDPINSNREKRKKMRTQTAGSDSGSNSNGKQRPKKDGRKTNLLYNEKGLLLVDQADLCDCLSDHCPGCFFPCQKCRSTKCGSECRVNRKWTLISVTPEGTHETTTNTHFPPTSM